MSCPLPDANIGLRPPTIAWPASRPVPDSAGKARCGERLSNPTTAVRPGAVFSVTSKLDGTGPMELPRSPTADGGIERDPSPHQYRP